MTDTQLETRLETSFEELKIEDKHRKTIRDILNEVGEHDEPTYSHSIRVGLKAREIAEFMHIDPKPALYGVLHGYGKTAIPKEIVSKKEGFDEKDMNIMKNHTIAGFSKLLQRGYMFSAWLALTHHRYQGERSYPRVLPGLPYALCEGTHCLLGQYSRIIAIADFHDALKRPNDKFGKAEMKAEKAREIMFAHNRDQEYLLHRLYEAGVLN
jgi:HD-GYP domain-containing protein (c-di-GMP phosphodiesterase class II)